MSVTVVGSIAYDAVKTPFGERERMLGGAATHFALAASFFDRSVSWGPSERISATADMAVLRTRGTRTEDVERVAGGERSSGRAKYGWDLNSRETLDTQLERLRRASSRSSREASRDCDVLFLANIQPDAAA